MEQEDYYFYRASQDARDDAYYLDIRRTQEEVLKEAERYRYMEERRD